MKEYSCGFLHVFLLRPLCAKMDGRGREGGEIAAAGRNSWTSDRLPDAMRVANIKRRGGGPDEIENLSAFYESIHDLVSYIFIWSCIYLTQRCTSVNNI